VKANQKRGALTGGARRAWSVSTKRAAWTAVVTLAAVSQVPAAAAQTIAITGGRVFPVSGPVIEHGTVLIQNGKIAAVGTNVTIPADARRIDAAGKWVTPGLINASTQLGVAEVGLVSLTRDDIAQGRDQVAAAFNVWEGLNTNSALFWPARDEGVTSVVILPGGGGLVWGQAAVVNLVDGMLSDMIIRAPVAMAAQLGNPAQGGAQARGELFMRLRELLEDAQFFANNRAAFDRAQARPFAISRKDLEALVPVVQGQLPLLVVVDRASDIDAVLNLARDYRLRLILASVAEGWMVADRIAAAGVPVLTGAMNNIPINFSALAQRQENAALLRGAGVNVLLIGNAGGGDERSFNVRNIKQQAGNAVAYGMSWDDALRAVTLGPAQVFGVADRLGALRPGMDADVVVWSGDPFEFSTRAEHVIVRGIERNTFNRQEQLTERYKQLPPNFYEP
jgi:imidazolonepropionase-like amidohydrolase